MAEYVSIIMKEKMNIDVELVKYPFDWDSNYLKHVDNNDVDAMLGVYSNYYDLLDFPNVRNLGTAGYIEKGGWFIPRYLAHSAPELTSYEGFKSVYEGTNAFCENIDLTSRKTY
eukprot:Awhi_evm1s6241